MQFKAGSFLHINAYLLIYFNPLHKCRTVS
jgi:hypothetical protein